MIQENNQTPSPLEVIGRMTGRVYGRVSGVARKKLETTKALLMSYIAEQSFTTTPALVDYLKNNCPSIKKSLNNNPNTAGAGVFLGLVQDLTTIVGSLCYGINYGIGYHQNAYTKTAITLAGVKLGAIATSGLIKKYYDVKDAMIVERRAERLSKIKPLPLP